MKLQSLIFCVNGGNKLKLFEYLSLSVLNEEYVYKTPEETWDRMSKLRNSAPHSVASS